MVKPYASILKLVLSVFYVPRDHASHSSIICVWEADWALLNFHNSSNRGEVEKISTQTSPKGLFRKVITIVTDFSQILPRRVCYLAF